MNRTAMEFIVTVARKTADRGTHTNAAAHRDGNAIREMLSYARDAFTASDEDAVRHAHANLRHYAGFMDMDARRSPEWRTQPYFDLYSDAAGEWVATISPATVNVPGPSELEDEEVV